MDASTRQTFDAWTKPLNPDQVALRGTKGSLDAALETRIPRQVSLLALGLTAVLAAALGSGVTAAAFVAVRANDAASSPPGSLVCANLCRRTAWSTCLVACDAWHDNATRPSALGPYL